MTPSQTQFVDELGPAQLLALIGRHAALIALLAAIGAGLGYLSTRVQGRYYETSALLQVMRPLVASPEGDVEIDDEPRYPSKRALRTVCLKDNVLIELKKRMYEEIEPDDPAAAFIPPGDGREFRQRLFVEIASDELFRLQTRAMNPIEAERMANVWAQIVVTEMRELYGVTQQNLDEMDRLIDEQIAARQEGERRKAELQRQLAGASDDARPALREQLIVVGDQIDGARQIRGVLYGRKAEMQMRFNEAHQVVRIIQHAATPTEPAGASPLVTVVLTTFAGAMIGLIFALIRGPGPGETGSAA
jgi:uncharacterized protein involved in exopolysaccharide biosynthesis